MGSMMTDAEKLLGLAEALGDVAKLEGKVLWIRRWGKRFILDASGRVEAIAIRDKKTNVIHRYEGGGEV